MLNANETRFSPAEAEIGMKLTDLVGFLYALQTPETAAAVIAQLGGSAKLEQPTGVNLDEALEMKSRRSPHSSNVSILPQ